MTLLRLGASRQYSSASDGCSSTAPQDRAKWGGPNIVNIRRIVELRVGHPGRREHDSFRTRQRLSIVAAMVLLGLVACGGDGGGTLPSAPSTPVITPQGSRGHTVAASEGIVVNQRFPLACSTFAEYDRILGSVGARRAELISSAIVASECTVFGISTEIWWAGEERTSTSSAPDQREARLLRIWAGAGLSPLVGTPSRPAGRWWISVSGTSFE